VEKKPTGASNWLVNCSDVMPDTILDECNGVPTGLLASYLGAEVENCTADQTCSQKDDADENGDGDEDDGDEDGETDKDGASILGTSLAFASMVMVSSFFMI